MTSEEIRSNPLFLRNQFESDGVFDMPIIRKQKIDTKDIQLVGYDHTKPDDKSNADSLVHFFLDDYKFEVLWNNPEPRIEKLRQYKAVLSPQFSVYYTMPFSMQIYNTFRSRWSGAYLQDKGLTVIPTVCWGKPQSYWYCFDGIEEGSVVALSTLGVKKEKDFFLQGYSEMLRRIKPKAVICYCDPFPEMKGNIITVDYAGANHLAERKKFWTRPLGNCYDKEEAIWLPEASVKTDGNYVAKTSGYIIETGMGSGGGARPAGEKPEQIHHIATNKHQYYTPSFEDITGKYGLDLDGDWNKVKLPHRGRHTSKYHDLVMGRMREMDGKASGDTDEFLHLFEGLRDEITQTHDLLYQKMLGETMYEVF